MISEGLYDIEE